jgi:hypothetical protein
LTNEHIRCASLVGLRGINASGAHQRRVAGHGDGDSETVEVLAIIRTEHLL